MIPRKVKAFLEWLSRALTNPRDELTRWQRTARFAYDLFRFGGKQLRQDRAPQMAAALAFHTLFGLLPVLVVSAIVARALMGREEFLAQAEAFFAALGLYQIELTAPTETEAALSLGAWLHEIVGQAMALNLAAVGWAGLIILVYTAISLVVTIENSFNTIYRAPEGRSWIRRVPLYWFLLTIAPLAMGLTLYIDNRFDLLIASFPLWTWAVGAIKVIWAFSMTWLILFVAYSFIPNTTVKYRATMIGAGVSAILVEIGRHGLDAYFNNAVSYSKIYGSLGLIPIFMMWVYLMWLAILFGLEVASLLQNLHGRRLAEVQEQSKPTGLVDPASIVTVMQAIAARFGRGESATPAEFANECGLREAQVQELIGHLEQRGFVYRLERPEGAFSLARPPDQISADRLLEIGFEIADKGRGPEEDSLLDRLRKAQLRIASETTLAGLMPRSAPE